MSLARFFEQTTPAPLMALSVVDSFARALRVRGDFPPPLGEIRCDILGVTVPVQTTFDPPRTLHAFRNRSGYFVLDGTYSTAAEPLRRWPLASGTYRVRLSGDFYQDAEFLLQWPLAAGERRVSVPQPPLPPLPPGPGSVELLPSPAYPLPDVTGSRFQLGPTILRGSAFEPDGSPVVGALAEVTGLPILVPPGNLPPLGAWPFLRTRTDARGDWVLVLPDRRYIDGTPEIPPGNPPRQVNKEISVSVVYPGGAAVTWKDSVRLGSEHAMRNTALRGQTLGPGGRPVAGATITTSVNALASKSRADGAWFLYFDPDQAAVPNLTVTATTPEGIAATASASLQPKGTVVVPAFQFP